VRLLAAALVLLATTTTTARAQGRTVELELAHGAVIRSDAPEAIAHVPEGVDASRPIALVVLLHGYSGCTRVLASAAPDARCRPRDHEEPGFGWAAAHDAAGRRSVLLIPQLAFRERNGSPGRFRIAGEAARFVDEALAALASTLGGRPTLGSITIAAHSAAFETTLAMLRHGGLEVRHVVLFDALYAGGASFVDWAAAGTDAAPRTLVSLATGGRTWTRTEQLMRDARRRTTVLAPESWPAPLPLAVSLVVGARVRVPHHDVPARFLAATLETLGLPAR
jgi:hypothetical protein